MTGITTAIATTTTTTEIYWLLGPEKEYFTVLVPLFRAGYQTARSFHDLFAGFLPPLFQRSVTEVSWGYR